MDYKFSNRCEFPDNSVGKLILCKDLAEILLFGKLQVQEQLKQMSVEEARKLLITLLTEKNPGSDYDKLTDMVGLHRGIRHQGRVLGGTNAVVKEGLLYLIMDSSKYGPVHPEAVERCIQGLGLRIEHKGLDIKREILPFEEYLSQEGEP